MAKSPEEMRKDMLTKLKETTGRTFPEWLRLIQTEKLVKHGEMMRFLKEIHGLTHGYANQIALEALRPADGPEPGSEELVEAQYAGKKGVLRPLYHKLVGELTKLGKDVEFAPKKAYVSVRRAKQFAIIQPTTATRLDVGINLKGHEPSERLEQSGSFNAMVSHRVRVTDAKEIDAQLIEWLKQAYDSAK